MGVYPKALKPVPLRDIHIPYSEEPSYENHLFTGRRTDTENAVYVASEKESCCVDNMDIPGEYYVK